jgi:phosphate transport system substrate-binding protein
MVTRGGSLPGQAAGFSSAELADIYAGRQSHWADGAPIRLVMRSAYESDTLLLRTLSPALDQAMGEALARKGMVIAENDLETLELLEKNPGSLGPVTLGLLRVRGSGLRLLALDGVLPSAQALDEGRYRLSKPFLLVFAKTPTAAARRLGDFLRSDKVRTLLKSYEFIPAR